MILLDVRHELGRILLQQNLAALHVAVGLGDSFAGVRGHRQQLDVESRAALVDLAYDEARVLSASPVAATHAT